MPDASYLQPNFLGGIWSPWMQGRIDLPKYRMAMNVCVNGIPVEEGAWTRRPGFQFLAPTRRQAAGRVIGYEYQENDPTILEFTDGYMRVFYEHNLLTVGSGIAVINISGATPAAVTTGAPHGLSTGMSVLFSWPVGGLNCASLRNRQFVVTVTSTTTFTIVDAFNLVPVPGIDYYGNPIWDVGELNVNQVVELQTPWTGGSWSTLRFISLGQQAPYPAGLQAILLNGGTPPQVITVTNPASPVFSINPAAFSDGPYNNVINYAVATPGSGTESPSYQIQGGPPWNNNQGYNTGEIVTYGSTSYISTTGGTSGNGGRGVPGLSSDWVAVTGSGAPGSYPTWTSGGSYTPWNGGSPPGSLVTYNGQTYAARDAGTFSFDGAQSPALYQTFSASWVPVNIITSEELLGTLLLTLSFAAWSTIIGYNTGDVTAYSGVNYISIQDNNLNNEPDTSPSWWKATTSAGLPFSVAGASSTDIGRSVRLFEQPPTWIDNATYQSGVNVTYNGAYYQAYATNTGAQPDISLSQWQPVSGGSVAYWTWGIVTAVNSDTEVVVQLLGAPLIYNTTPVGTYQVGAFSNTTGWPTCGFFYDGRLWLAGAAPNRVDGSASDTPFTFSPSNPDGSVGDSNAITLIFNSTKNELVQWLRAVQQGILVGTLTHERLINASTQADVLTPSTAQENPVTSYGSAFIEPVAAGLAAVFVQRFGRQLMEMVANVFSGKYNAPNLALPVKHLTSSAVKELAYQEEIVPNIWARLGNGKLLGCTYRRVTAFSTDNPALTNEPSTFAAWHEHELGSEHGVDPLYVMSISTTQTPDGATDQLAIVTQTVNGYLPNSTGGFVQVMTPFFEVADPIYNANFLDQSIVPPVGEIVTYGTPAVTYLRLYGLTYTGAAFPTMSAWVGGLDCGEYVVQPNGYIDIPYGGVQQPLLTAAYVAGLSAAGYDGTTNAVTVNTTVAGVSTPFTVGTITQLIVPSDAYGTPTWALVDWNNNYVYLIDTSSHVRTYSLNTTGAQSPVVSASLANGLNGTVAAVDPVHGLFVAQSNNADNFREVTTYFPFNLNAYKTFGHNTTFSSYPTDVLDAEAMVCIGVGTVASGGQSQEGYTLLKESVFSGNVDVLFTNEMTAAGFSSAVVSGSTDNRGYMCAGASGPFFGSAFLTWNGGVQGMATSYPLYAVYIAQGAETYSIASWPTANPYITYQTLGTIAASSVDPAWTHLQVNSIGYDALTTNVIMDVTTSDSVAHTHYIIGVNSATAEVVWAQAAGSIGDNLGGYAISGVVPALGHNAGYTVSAAGTVTIALPSIGQDGDPFLQPTTVMGNSNTGVILADLSYAQTVGGPTPTAGTPTSFSGFALLTGGPTETAPTATTQVVPAVVGVTYTSQGQILRAANAQEAGAANGPAQGKTRRTHHVTALLEGTQGISFGVDFTHLFPAPLLSYINGPPIPVTELYSGVFWDAIDADYDFDNMLCWQVIRPYPATVVNIGGFLQTQDR